MGNGWQSGHLQVSDSRAGCGWLICILVSDHCRGRTGSSLWSSKTLRPWSRASPGAAWTRARLPAASLWSMRPQGVRRPPKPR
jgi:hypothetical protein